MSRTALIVGAGSGNSASFARALRVAGFKLVLAARNISKLEALCNEIGATSISCDASSAESVGELFEAMEKAVGVADTVLYNASAYSAGHGSIFFTGATASVKGFPGYAPFAMGKFALRGLAQSLARELGPQNIHVAHFIIDGGIASPGRDIQAVDQQYADDQLEPDAIAQTYMAVLNQHRSAWTHEIDLRPWVESF